jgi:hypothetical protein
MPNSKMYGRPKDRRALKDRRRGRTELSSAMTNRERSRREEQKQRTIAERVRYNLRRSNLKLTGELNSKV